MVDTSLVNSSLYRSGTLVSDFELQDDEGHNPAADKGVNDFMSTIKPKT